VIPELKDNSQLASLLTTVLGKLNPASLQRSANQLAVITFTKFQSGAGVQL